MLKKIFKNIIENIESLQNIILEICLILLIQQYS